MGDDGKVYSEDLINQLLNLTKKEVHISTISKQL